MKITALVENHYNLKESGTRIGDGAPLKARHGLSLYIETMHHKILFDVGPDQTLFHNAALRHIDLTQVDTVIISHGHMDHGGALKHFLALNHQAKVYVQRRAFVKHTSKFLWMQVNVGLDPTLMKHPQIVLLDGDTVIDEELQVFTLNQTREECICYSNANDALYEEKHKDLFAHEQNLIITENQTVLVMGCGHAGVVNIMNKAADYKPEICIGGYHVYNPMTKRTVPEDVLDQMIQQLKCYDHTEFYTCHCTGTKAFRYMAERMQNMHYLSCGTNVTF